MSLCSHVNASATKECKISPSSPLKVHDPTASHASGTLATHQADQKS